MVQDDDWLAAITAATLPGWLTAAIHLTGALLLTGLAAGLSPP